MSETQRGERRQEQETQEETESTSETNNCNDCGGRLRTNESRGEVVCEDCGLVAEQDEIDRGPEWRAFDSQERDEKSRVGAPTTNLMHDKGLSTDIGWQNKDAHGRTLSSTQREKMKRLRTWNERFRTQDSKERNLKQALGEVERMASALGLNKQVKETASVLYRRCLEEDMLPGRSIEAMVTASLYAACRQCDMPRALDDFFPVTRARDDMEVKRAYKYIMKELNLGMEPIDPRSFLNQYLSDLGDKISNRQKMRQSSEEILDATERENLHSGKSPTALAAGAIYASGLIHSEDLTQGEVGEVASKSTVTIRNRYQDMLKAYRNENAE